jgi:hypothetical protein
MRIGTSHTCIGLEIYALGNRASHVFLERGYLAPVTGSL